MLTDTPWIVWVILAFAAVCPLAVVWFATTHWGVQARRVRAAGAGAVEAACSDEQQSAAAHRRAVPKP